MPITINEKLPAATTLAQEGIFIMSSTRAETQDIRPLRIAILNIMPTKEQTETQLMRLLANSPLQVEVILLHPATHIPKNTSIEYLNAFYKTFDDVREEKFDGLIITGAPVEQLPFEEVTYWKELIEIMEWSKRNVYSTIHICWAAQAGLYYHYGINKRPLEKKLSGIFLHEKLDTLAPIVRGFDDQFWAPHSRYTETIPEEVYACPKVEVLCQSQSGGLYMLLARHGRQIFLMGHPEYDKYTLKMEYERDVAKGLRIEVPQDYFRENNPKNDPVVRWKAHANLLFYNWLNYYVYQETPYDVSAIKPDQEG